MGTLVLVIILNIVHTAYVSPKVSSLGELHRTETTSVGFLPRVLQTVAFHALFLGESSATILTFIGPHTCVNTLMSGHLRRLQEFLFAVFASKNISFSRMLCKPMFSPIEHISEREFALPTLEWIYTNRAFFNVFLCFLSRWWMHAKWTKTFSLQFFKVHNKKGPQI